MSKHELKNEIVHELEKVNRTIDRKILRGVAYRSESRRHLQLLKLLRKVNAAGHMGLRHSFSHA